MQYRNKKKNVNAIQFTEDFMSDGKLVAKKGDWMIVHGNGKQEVITDDEFQKLYELDADIAVTKPAEPATPYYPVYPYWIYPYDPYKTTTPLPYYPAYPKDYEIWCTTGTSTVNSRWIG